MYKYIFGLLLLLSFDLKAQTVVDSLSSLNFTFKDTLSDQLADLVVQKHNRTKVADKQIEAGLYEWKRTKTFWAANITPSFNLNEGNLRAQDSAFGNLFFPRYNLNLSVPLSTFFSRPKEAKKAKALYEESIVQKDMVVQELRLNIKLAYQNYLSNLYLLALQDAVMKDEQVLLSQVQENFESNKISLEAFTNANKRYNLEVGRRLLLLKDVNASKAQLELLLGMSLEAAVNEIRAGALNLNTKSDKK